MLHTIRRHSVLVDYAAWIPWLISEAMVESHKVPNVGGLKASRAGYNKLNANTLLNVNTSRN